MSYRQDAASDAAETVRNFEGEILEQLLDKGEALRKMIAEVADNG